MSQYFSVHQTHPQRRLLAQAADIVRGGGVIVYPTDSTYALGCHIGDKTALDRIRAIRRLDKLHHFTLVCRDLSELSIYARVENTSYRILKHYTPGAFTFLLHASREVPKRLGHPVTQLPEPFGLKRELVMPRVDVDVHERIECRFAHV